MHADAPARTATRGLRPDDLYRVAVPTDPRLSPDGRNVVFTLQTVAPSWDGYRHALWIVPTDASAPARRLTIGAHHDTRPRFSPDGSQLAFLSDRRLAVEELPSALPDREDGVQVHLLPMRGGEARRLTDLPRGVTDLAWAPDGASLVAVSTSLGATRELDARRRGRRTEPPKPGRPPVSDYRYTDRLQYLYNGDGFVNDRIGHLWLVDAETGDARQLTSGETGDSEPAWSPDGSRIAFVSNRRRDWDLSWRSDIFVLDVATGSTRRISGGGRCLFGAPAWLPDGRTIAALGHRFPAEAGSRNDIWLFAADGSDDQPDGGRNVTATHDLMPASSMNSDVVVGEEARLHVARDGRRITFRAPIEGSYELWQIALEDARLERLTDDHEYVSSFDQVALADGSVRLAFLRSTASILPDVHVLDLPARGEAAPAPARRLTDLHAGLLAEVALVEPVERWHEVDGRRIQGWFLPAAASVDGVSPGPAVTEIHGGPQTLYGWSPVLEFQVLAANGIGVYYCNPRGSEGYGQAFAHANFADWGTGPSTDVLAGVDALVADGLARPDRLGVTGGSYGGYLTSWIVGHDQRFAAAITCRSVSDMALVNLTGDLAGGEFGRIELGADPWDDPELYRAASPITYARAIRTPLLIQHAENDLRCPIGQAEMLFAVLRSLRRPVRLMRVPGESHELTRSGTPFRRVENLVQVRDWFRHYLVLGRRGLPPMPRARART